MIFKKNKTKIFCIGRNKTGTTSLEMALKEFGFKIGNQEKAELLIKDYKIYNWKPIINYCKTSDAFQDAPFSWPYTWIILKEHFPNAKFILTIRNEEDWYKSKTRFNSKLFSKENKIPVKNDLINASYRYKGFVWDVSRAVWKTPEDDIYNKNMMIENYNRHNNDVLHFFKDDPNFLSIDVSKENSYLRLCSFLKKNPLHKVFPHLNKT